MAVNQKILHKRLAERILESKVSSTSKRLSDSKIFIVIAAYNEDKKIAKVIRGLKQDGYHNIVVVDDGSRDNTCAAALKEGAITLRHIVNRGQGAALRTGMDYSIRQGADFIVHFDADGQHSAKEIEKMLEPVVSGRYDIALGSRFLRSDSRSKNIPLTRKILLKGAVIVQWLFYGIKLSDAHNGFRAFTRKAAKTIRIRSDRMEHASEIIEEIARHKLRFVEVPVTIKYDEYSIAHGHGSYFGALRVLFKMLLRKITGQ